MKKKFVMISVFFTMSMLIGIAVDSIAYAQKKPAIDIGVLLQLSGWYSVVDTGEAGDCEIVARMINDRGGLTIQGQKYNVRLIVEDGKSTFDGCTTVANKLIWDHKVKFVVGPSGPFPTASTPAFEAAKVLHVSGYNNLEKGAMDSSTPYSFLGLNDPIAQFSVQAKSMKKVFPDVKTVVIASADEPSTDLVVPHVKKSLEKMGYKVIDNVVKFPLEAEDFSSIAVKLNAIKNADAYFTLYGTPPGLANILKGLRAIGNNKPYIVSCPAIHILGIAGKDASNNVLCAVAYTPNQRGNPPLLDEVYNRGKAGRQFYGMTPNALWILAQVIQAANSLDPAVVKAKWESMRTVSTLYGEGVMAGDKTYGLKGHCVNTPYPYATIMNGKITHGGWLKPDPTE